jgi:hypothetical protein
MRGRIVITVLLGLLFVMPAVSAVDGRAAPGCIEMDLSSISSQELIGSDSCIKLDLGVHSHGDVLEFDITVSEGDLDLLLFDENGILAYDLGNSYRSYFIDEASFEGAFGEYEFDWQVFSPPNKAKNWYVVLDNHNHDGDGGQGGQGLVDARVAFDMEVSSEWEWTPYHDVVKVDSEVRETLLGEGKLVLDAETGLEIKVEPISGSADIYIQTLEQSSGNLYISGTLMADVDSTNSLSWTVPANFNGQSLILQCDNSAGSEEFRATITVKASPPLIAVITDDIDDILTIGETFTLDATSSPNLLNQISFIRWDMDGDGSYELQGSTIQHSYDEPGTYNVSVELISAVQSTSYGTHVVEVSDVIDPIAKITGTGTQLLDGRWKVEPNSNIYFSSITSSDDDEIATRAWSLDGTSYDGGESVTLQWSEPGSHNLILTITDSSGNADSDNVTVFVDDETKPVIDEQSIDSVKSALVGDAVTFSASAIDAFDDSSQLVYTWDVHPSVDADGDGDKRNDADLTGKTVKYTFVETGHHDVVLTVRDASGNSDSHSIEVIISAQPESSSGFAIFVVILFIAAITGGLGVVGNRIMQRKHAVTLLVERGFSIAEAEVRVEGIARTKSLPMLANAMQLAGLDDGQASTQEQMAIAAKAAEMAAIYGAGGSTMQTSDPNAGFRPAIQQTSQSTAMLAGEALAGLMGEEQVSQPAIVQPMKSEEEFIDHIRIAATSTPKSQPISAAKVNVRSGGISLPSAKTIPAEEPLGIKGSCSACSKGFMIDLPSGVNEALVDCPHCGVEVLFTR